MTTLLIGLALAVGAPAKKDRAPKEPSLIGEWFVESMLFGGKPWKSQPGGTFQFMADGKMVIKGKDGEKTGTYRTDTKKNPAEVDLDVIGPDWILPGIFKIDGDTLIICHVFGEEQPRPKKFESPVGSFNMVITLKRTKTD